MGWVWHMAWRDSRGQRRRLLLYTSAIAVGIASLTALRGLGHSMEENVDRQAATLLGADMELETESPFTPELKAFIDSLGGEQSHQVTFTSMVRFLANGGTRLIQVRALEGDYPYYGELRTEPTAAAQGFRQGREALVDEGLMLQFGVEIGDSVRVGYASFRIAGRLLQAPGQTAVRADIQPPVLIPRRYLEETGLVRRGSRVEYQVYFRFDDGRDPERIKDQIEARFGDDRAMDIDVDTVSDRIRRMGRTLGNLYRYLGLGSFIALLLGAVGVASAVHTHIQQKLETVAILRSLGASAGQAFRIYLLQAASMGFVGSLAGALVGTVLVLALPGLVADFLPTAVELTFSLVPLLEGVAIGTSIALAFAALPLLAVRRTSPLLALRASYEARGRGDDLGWRLGLGIVALIGTLLLALLLTQRPDHALYFTGGTALALVLLAAAGHLMRAVTRRLLPPSLSYIWRQGMANLYRPHNQTLLMLVSLGLATFLITAFYLAQDSLLAHIDRVTGDDQPNIVVFDIQTDQRDPVAALATEIGLPLIEQVPIVSMYLAEVNGHSFGEVTGGRGRRGNWAFKREYRSTYRDHLASTETLVAGTWRGRTTGDTAYVSLEQGIAADLGVGVGDELVFDVQGVPISVVVGSTRQVDWQRIMPNFFVVFPTGVLEEAPQFHVLVTRAPDVATRAAWQRRAVERFPNLSIIDLDLVLSTVDEVLDKVAVIVRFMALFSIGTGVLVLVAVVSSSRSQRLREGILLRTLGASRGQVLSIFLVEYFILGCLAGLAGMLLAIAGGWGLTRYVFDIAFGLRVWPLVIAFAAAPLLTLAVGLAGSRSAHSAPPLAVLREVG